MEDGTPDPSSEKCFIELGAQGSPKRAVFMLERSGKDSPSPTNPIKTNLRYKMGRLGNFHLQ
jgi:hypothetical protein